MGLLLLLSNLILISCIWVALVTATGGNNATDKEALLEFKNKVTDDPLGVLSSWNHSVHFCQWFGVTCGRRLHQRVIELNLESSQVTGTISPHIGNLSFLRKLRLGDNKFTGEVPSLGNLIHLSHLYFGGNYLGTGESHGHDDLSFICSLINASKLYEISLPQNNFGGKLPKCIGKLSSTPINHLGIGDNFLVGGVPSEIGELGSLTSLSLENNKLTGRIPVEIGMLTNLVLLTMEENKLSGEIPLSLGNLTSLDELYLNGNNLQGNIPSSLGRCTKLLILNISDNNLNGTIPPGVMSLSSFSRGLFLSGNHLTGSLPTEVGDLKNIGVLDVSRNMLSGEIPSSIGGCTSLVYLDLSENSFSGAVPNQIESLRGVSYFNVGRNKLSGEVPKFLGSFVILQTLNLSYNNFEGPLPVEGVFKNSRAVSVVGNRGLCGGIPELGLPRCELKHRKKSTLRIILIFVLEASGIFGILLVFAYIISGQLRNKARKPELVPPGKSIPNVSYHSLVKATNGFSSAELLGKGSFGSVYKGILSLELDTIVAIKVLDPLCRRAFKSFAAECEALRNIRHRNLIKILTACSGTDYRGGDFKALVYEYMPNGNLEMWLHSASNCCRNTMVLFRKLGFFERLQIAIDVASALEYLHLHCQPPIAHCDLKPSNILLDAEMVAHVGDFGLARILQEATSIDASDNNSSCFGVGLTIGYAPPEYGFGSEISIRGDVYSYGILLLEMFTGKRPTDEMFTESLTLRIFVNEALPDNLRSILDPTLMNDEEEMAYIIRTGNAECFKECLKAILEIGLACSEFAPRERLSMNAVVTELTGILTCICACLE